jgi:hypothetical protein
MPGTAFVGDPHRLAVTFALRVALALALPVTFALAQPVREWLQRDQHGADGGAGCDQRQRRP